MLLALGFGIKPLGVRACGRGFGTARRAQGLKFCGLKSDIAGLGLQGLGFIAFACDSLGVNKHAGRLFGGCFKCWKLSTNYLFNFWDL